MNALRTLAAGALLAASGLSDAQVSAPKAPIAWGSPTIASPAPPASTRPPAAVRTAEAAAPPAGGLRLRDVLAMPDTRPIKASDGSSVNAGELKRRYAKWLHEELAAQRPGPKQRFTRAALTTSAGKARVNGVVQASGSGLRSVDAKQLAEWRDAGELDAVEGSTALPARAVKRVGPSSGELAPLPGRQFAASLRPCTSAQAAFTTGSAHFLSAVNRRGKDFWINLDADERILVLAGCFGRKSGEVRVQGNFPRGFVVAQVITWDERQIVAQVPALTGVFDQDISVRVVPEGGQLTNERIGHLWARRETRTLDDLAVVASSGDCVAQADRDAQGAFLVAKVPPLYDPGFQIQWGEQFSTPGTCELPKSDATPSGVTHFNARLAPGWEVIDLSLQPRIGSAQHAWVGDTDFDVRWRATTFSTEHRLFGVLMSRESFHALDFVVSQVQVRGPVGTAPAAQR